ncbi:MAG: hypothetical protein ACR2LK_02790 [Solirubrobacteraceae bacterium]
MLKHTLISLLSLTAIAAAPAAASAADTVVAPGAEPTHMTALRGNVVWIAGDYPRQTLMRRDADGRVAPVRGAPTRAYRSIDLGIDSSGRLVLTYLRCVRARNCKAFSDDLAGHRTSFRRLVPRRCELIATPSRWRNRIAYGLRCDRLRGRPNVHDSRRSGLFVRKGARPAKRLRLPKAAVRFGNDDVRWVDLRGTNVGAVASDIFAFAFSQTVNGSRLRSTEVAGSEGETDERVAGMSLGSGRALWTLVNSSHGGDPNEARIDRFGADGCVAGQTLTNVAESTSEEDRFNELTEGYVAEAMAVDGSTLYLYKPGVGIVVHEFDPSRTCP